MPSEGTPDAVLGTTRRRVLAGLGALAGAGVIGASTQTNGGGASSLGGGTDDQDRVPVYELLTILADDGKEIAADETVGPYNGFDWRDGGTLVWEDSGEIELEDMPQ